MQLTETQEALLPSEEANVRCNRLDLIEKQRIEEDAEAEARKSNFQKFYQINQEQSHHFTTLISKNPKAAAILNFIFEKMDKSNALICSYKIFQARFEISQATVARSIKYLQDNGFIHVMKSGTSNVYVANPNLVWKTYGKNAKYCEFPANIILDFDEQEQAYKDMFKTAMHTEIVEKVTDEGKTDTDTSNSVCKTA